MVSGFRRAPYGHASPSRSFPALSALQCIRIFGSLAEFVGKRAVEKAAAWKSPKAGLFPSAWKSRKSGGMPTFSTVPATTGKLSDFTPSRGIAELQQGRLVCCLSVIDTFWHHLLEADFWPASLRVHPGHNFRLA